jgi:pimeloyl-ACP methyl ester carboxylesterase
MMIELVFAHRKGMASLCALAACVWLSACVSVTVDERTAFAPPKRDAGPATTVTELQSRWTQSLAQGQASGSWQTQVLSNGAMRINFLKPRRASGAIPAPMIVRHGFIGEGAGRVAWSMFTGVGTDDQERSPDRPLVVHCAGNAGDRYNSGGPYAIKIMPWADVLVFDYPGYGDTPGPASAPAFEAAAQGLATYISGISQNRKLVFWGHSLGGFVCSRLAASVPGADGLVLETTAPSAAAVAKVRIPSYARLFVRANVAPSLATYDVVASSAQVKGPVLVFGAAKDTVLPVPLARQVGEGLKLAGANVTYVEFPDAQHWNVPSQPAFAEAVTTFFKSVESQP